MYINTLKNVHVMLFVPHGDLALQILSIHKAINIKD